MSSVTLNAGVRAALSSLQNTSAISQQIQNRLATGKKVNSALDNPSNFFLSAGLNARGSDLSNLLDTMGQNIKVLEAADKGITAITKLVESTQATARQALQSASVNLKTTGTANLSAYTAAAGDAGNLVITVGGTNKTVAVAAGDTGAQIVDKINAAGGLKAELDAGTGRLSISALNGESLAIDATSTAATLTALGLSAGAVTRGTSEVNATRKALAAQVAELRTQIDQLSKDASYNGINLLAGDAMTTVFNETGSSKQKIQGVTFDAAGLKISAAKNDFQADSDINAALTELKSAAETLRAQASTFGANLSVLQNRQDFTKGLINTLTTGADSLVLADPNEEGAKLLALQTRQQLSQTAMSLANQADSAVLRLF